jgi:hypothetical protein
MNNKLILFTGFFLSCLLIFKACEKKEKVLEPIALKGIIELIQDDSGLTDEGSLVLNVRDESNNYEVYYISMRKKGRELLKYVGATVDIKGKSGADLEGNKTLYVKAYEILEEGGSRPKPEKDK